MRLDFLVAAGAWVMLVGAAPAAVAEYDPMPAEAGNTTPHCIRWSVTEVPDGNANTPDKVRLIFSFRNQCPRDAHVALFWSYKSRGSISGKQYFTIPALQSFGNSSTGTTHVLYSRAKNKGLRIWVLESPHPFVKGNLPDTARCDDKFNPRKKAPACPKYFTY